MILFKSHCESIERQICNNFSLLDPESEMEIISYRVSQILFCARGPTNTPLSYCWAFTTSRPSTMINQQNSLEKSPNEVLYQCQVFRCENQDAVRPFLFFSFRENENV